VYQITIEWECVYEGGCGKDNFFLTIILYVFLLPVTYIAEVMLLMLEVYINAKTNKLLIICVPTSNLMISTFNTFAMLHNIENSKLLIIAPSTQFNNIIKSDMPEADWKKIRGEKANEIASLTTYLDGTQEKVKFLILRVLEAPAGKITAVYLVDCKKSQIIVYTSFVEYVEMWREDISQLAFLFHMEMAPEVVVSLKDIFLFFCIDQ
jgi:hypothetical protein